MGKELKKNEICLDFWGGIKNKMRHKKIRECSEVKVIVMVKNHEDYKEKVNKSIFDGFLSMSKQVDSLVNYRRDDLHER